MVAVVTTAGCSVLYCSYSGSCAVACYGGVVVIVVVVVILVGVIVVV